MPSKRARRSRATQPDVVFLDIEMPRSSGTTLAASLPEPRPFVVFATAFDQYALDAFAVDATDYLVKPITRARLAGTLARVRERLSRRSDLERELVAASAAQAQLLPRALPPIPGFDARRATLPARGVGGDFFSAQPLGLGPLRLALGDVVRQRHAGGPGGVEPAGADRNDRAPRRRHAPPTWSPRSIGRSAARSEGARFATLGLPRDRRRRRGPLQLVNAGHPPVLIVTPDGRARARPSTGPALGHAARRALRRRRRSTLAAGRDARGLQRRRHRGARCRRRRVRRGAPGATRCARASRARTAARSSCRARCSTLAQRSPRRGLTPSSDDVTVLVIKRVSGNDGPGFSRGHPVTAA